MTAAQPSLPPCLLAIDQGTTSTRVLAVTPSQSIVASHQIGLKQHYPASGWVEHDADDIWTAVSVCLKEVLNAVKGRYTPLAVGITNQRETCLLWERATGKPAYRAIVWQDRRTASLCEQLASREGFAARITRQTGLLLDPYFSATKLAWLLDDPAGPKLRTQAEAGALCFGTIESYLTYRLTAGKAHVSDASNASRTMLCDIRSLTWSDDILAALNIPADILPTIVSCTENVGTIADGLPGSGLAVTGLIGDQQSAAVGQGCITPGSVKSTYGTGCFVLQNTGDELIYSQSRLLSTVAYQSGGRVSYAVEGSIFNAGTVVQWCRDEMGLIETAEDSEDMVSGLNDTGGVYMVPAFTGLGAPYWDADARGIITGITRNTSRAQMVRAGLESVVYQTADLMAALRRDGAQQPEKMRIDGGMAANGWFAQYLTDILDTPTERPKSIETTAIGAALCAGVGAGLWPDLQAATAGWQADAAFTPKMDASTRTSKLTGWAKAVRQCLAQ